MGKEMNVLLAKITKEKLSPEILHDLRLNYDFQLKPETAPGDYFGCHLAMDKESTAVMKNGGIPQNAKMLYLTPEVFELALG